MVLKVVILILRLNVQILKGAIHETTPNLESQPLIARPIYIETSCLG